MRNLILFLISFLLFFSCLPVRFDKPVPVNSDKMFEFPDSLIGDYFVVDSMFQKDTNKIIYNGKYFSDIYKYKDSANILNFKISISKYTVEIDISGKSYYDTCKIDMIKYLNTGENYKIDGKYIVNEERSKDTLVNLNDKDILKSLNSIFYLNLYNAENDWETYQLFCKNDSILDVNVMNRSKLGGLPRTFKIEYTLFAANIKNINDKKFRYLLDNKYFEKYITIKKYAR